MKIGLMSSALACGALLIGVSFGASAAPDRTFGEIYTDCGIGAMIAPKTEAVAAVTNVTWDLGTTAISSNISSPSTCRGGKARMASLIYSTYPSMESDVAAGTGENLDSLVALAGCNGDRSASYVKALRADFARKASADGYANFSRKAKASRLFEAARQARQDVGADACHAAT